MTQQTRRQFMTICAAGLSGATAAFGEHTSGSANKFDFTFAAINDTHVKDDASTDIVARAVAHINADKRIQFTVVLGDIATDGLPEELRTAKTVLDDLSCPWYAVPGNHDVAMDEADPYVNYTAAFGPGHWAFEHRGWTFIGFDSCEETKSFVTVAEPEMIWLREQAARLDPGRPVGLFCHHPLNPNTRNYRILNADEVLDVFSGKNLRIVAAGHWHGNQLEQESAKLFATTACCASTRGNFDGTDARGYRLFHVSDQVVETAFVEIPLTGE